MIPLKGDLSSLKLLFQSLAQQSESVNEIIVVQSGFLRSSQRQIESSGENINRLRRFRYLGLNILLCKSAQIMLPGQARNIGISKSCAQNIAFLDQNTIPSPQWLPNSLNIMNINGCPVLSGRTRYTHTNYIQKIIIAASYGFLPLTSVPGTILERQALYKLGYFLPYARAAEDIAFMSRVKEFYRASSPSSRTDCSLAYALHSSSIHYYIYKWYRNYTLSASYTLLSLQQTVLFFLLVILLLLISYSWNSVVARWVIDSPVYIPFFSRSMLALIILAYVLVRGFLLPFRKGAYSRGRCNILDSLSILAISFLLDLSKSAALIYRVRKSLFYWWSL